MKLTIRVAAGQTITFLAGCLYWVMGNSTFQLDPTPPPTASIWSSPFDPSVFDAVQFYNYSFDPGDVGVASSRWEFGDGTGSNETSPSHRYARDGDYDVTLTVGTADGRSASQTRSVQVRTHDVAIASFAVPPKGRVGRSSEITVGVSNSRVPETVQVQLLRNDRNGGWEQVGVGTQSVVVEDRKTTPFVFSYTFTHDDLAAGNVTFQMVATIVGARDAIPGNNTVVSSPVVVTT